MKKKIEKINEWNKRVKLLRWIFLFAGITFFCWWRSTLNHNGYFVNLKDVLISSLAGAVAGILLSRPILPGRRGVIWFASVLLLLFVILFIIKWVMCG